MRLWVVLQLAANEEIHEPLVFDDEDVALNEAQAVAERIAQDTGVEAINFWDEEYSPDVGRFVRRDRQVEVVETELRYAESTSRR